MVIVTQFSKIQMTSLLRIFALQFLAFVGSCHHQEKVNEPLASRFRADQIANHFVIGYINSNKLNYLNVGNDGNYKEIVTMGDVKSISQVATLDRTSPSPVSIQGKYLVSCYEHKPCIVTNNSSNTKFEVAAEDARSGLIFNQNSNYAFAIYKSPNWRFPQKCPFEDERDVVVYDTTSGEHFILTTLCGGFPYGNLQWYLLM